MKTAVDNNLLFARLMYSKISHLNESGTGQVAAKCDCLQQLQTCAAVTVTRKTRYPPHGLIRAIGCKINTEICQPRSSTPFKPICFKVLGVLENPDRQKCCRGEIVVYLTRNDRSSIISNELHQCPAYVGLHLHTTLSTPFYFL